MNDVGKSDRADWLVIDQQVDDGITFVGQFLDTLVPRVQSSLADIVRAHDSDAMSFDNSLSTLAWQAFGSLVDGTPEMSNCYCYPGRAGGSLADAS